MRNVRHIIILILCLCTTLAWGQRRYSASERASMRMANKRGFSKREPSNKTDALLGLHASFYSGPHHLIGVSAEGAWTSFATNMPDVTVKPGGGAAGMHFLYEFQINMWMFQTGLGVAFQQAAVSVPDSVIYHINDPRLVDPVSGFTYTLKTAYHERRDEARQVYAQLPLYFGRNFFVPQGIGYFLAGVRLSYSLWGDNTRRFLYTTTGKVERIGAILEQMPENGFREDVSLERKGGPMKLNMDVMAHAEIGYEYSLAQSSFSYRNRKGGNLDCRLRAAAFADFGILNISPEGNKVLWESQKNPPLQIYERNSERYYPAEYVFETSEASKYWMRNVFVGLRLSVMFGFQIGERCILCDPWKY